MSGGRFVALFLDMLAAERGAAENTLSAYRRDLDDYAAFLAAKRIDASTQSREAPRRMSRSSVRDAFATSVTCARPPVSRQIRNDSTVPAASSPRSARSRAPATLSSSQASFVAEK